MINSFLEKLQGRISLFDERSNQWPKVRAKFLKANPFCACCGSNEKLEVHHIIPFSVAPEFELDETNLITLCESKKLGFSCHRIVGHLGNWRIANKFVSQDSATWFERTNEYRKNEQKLGQA